MLPLLPPTSEPRAPPARNRPLHPGNTMTTPSMHPARNSSTARPNQIAQREVLAEARAFAQLLDFLNRIVHRLLPTAWWGNQHRDHATMARDGNALALFNPV